LRRLNAVPVRGEYGFKLEPMRRVYQRTGTPVLDPMWVRKICKSVTDGDGGGYARLRRRRVRAIIQKRGKQRSAKQPDKH
jgi:hypothetical protein